MRLLAYDTSGDVLSAALAEDGRIITQLESSAGSRHSDELVPMLEKLLRRARWKPESLGLLAVGVGPGSFTGLRVGVAAAKMLALVWDKKLAGVPSLEALAYEMKGTRLPAGQAGIPIAVDARRGKIYAALYERKGEELKEIFAPALSTLEEFSKIAGQEVNVLERAHINAASVARAGWARARSRRTQSAGSLEALYLHPKDCNVTIKNKK